MKQFLVYEEPEEACSIKRNVGNFKAILNSVVDTYFSKADKHVKPTGVLGTNDRDTYT